MKRILYLHILLIGCLTASAQVPGINAGSIGGSGLIEAPLIPLGQIVEPRLAKEVKDFREIYEHRAEYYAATALDAGKVVNEVDDLLDRVNLLIADNEALNFFYTFKKRDNRTKLNTIKTGVERLKNELTGLSLELNTIYGERMNLNQNVEMTLEQMHRQVDEIDSDISKSRILSQLLGL